MSKSNERTDKESGMDNKSIVMLPADEQNNNPYQSELAEALRKRGHEVVLTKPRPVLPVLQTVQSTNSDILHFHWLHYYVLDDNPIVMAVKALQFFFELAIYRLVFDGTVVWTVHNQLEHKKRWPTAERWIKRTFLLYFSDRAIVHCNQASKAICTEFNLPDTVMDRIAVVPHGHYIDVYENEVSRTIAREKLGLSDEEQAFLFIGSIRPYKQVPKLIESFKAINADKARLVIAGKPWNNRLTTVIQQQCDDRNDIQTRLEIVPESEFQIYLNAADVAVFPFHSDMLTSGSVILAMSFGTGVIAPNVGCLPETLPPDGAILYDPTDATGLKEALEAALDANLECMGVRNYEKVAKINWEFVAAETEAVYEGAKRR